MTSPSLPWSGSAAPKNCLYCWNRILPCLLIPRPLPHDESFKANDLHSLVQLEIIDSDLGIDFFDREGREE